MRPLLAGATLLVAFTAACRSDRPVQSAAASPDDLRGMAAELRLRDTAAPPTAVGGGPLADSRWSRAETIERLAAARCDQLHACNQIGTIGGPETWELCVQKERDRAAQRYEASSCPLVDARAGQACIDATRSASCSGESTAAMDACRSADLCIAPPTL